MQTEPDPVIEASLRREAELTDPEEIEDERLFRYLHENGLFDQPGERITVEDLERIDAELRAQGR